MDTTTNGQTPDINETPVQNNDNISNEGFFQFCSAHAVIILSTPLPARSPTFTKPNIFKIFGFRGSLLPPA